MSIKPNHLSQSKLKEIWAQVPPNYYDEGIKKNLFQKTWHTHKLTQILKLLHSNPRSLREKLRLLDVGCSSGVLTAAIAETLPKATIIGLDSYRQAIIFARSKYPHIDFKIGDAHKLPFQDKAFDLVICTETLEHLVDPKQALVEIKRVLKKDGKAIISMDSGSLLFKIVWYLWTKTKGRVWQDAHLHEFNGKLLENLIKEAGFIIKKRITSHLGMAVIFLAVPKKN